MFFPPSAKTGLKWHIQNTCLDGNLWFSSTFSFSVDLLIFLKLRNSTAGDEALERFCWPHELWHLYQACLW